MENDEQKSLEYQIYIAKSKKNIDTLLSNKEYQKAFHLLIIVLSRLETTDITEFVKYYDNYMENESKNKIPMHKLHHFYKL